MKVGYQLHRFIGEIAASSQLPSPRHRAIPFTMIAPNVIILIVSGIEVAWLSALHCRALVQWEPIWVIAMT